MTKKKEVKEEISKLKELLDELLVALKNEGRDSLVYLLMDWEIDGLDSIISSLKEYNVEFDILNDREEESEDGEEKKKKKNGKSLLKITEDVVLDPKYITGYRLFEKVSQSNSVDFICLLNPSQEETFYNNIQIRFVSEKQREYFISRLLRKLEFFNVIIK